ncbi:hypothetical protein HanRHA438_Chr12g0542271 [Helianthus annuus]|nr:hypothetical protein HanRHA438_Chr12g0542271 [Helianthus annuus]
MAEKTTRDTLEHFGKGPGFSPVLKRRILEQNGAKMEHSSKLPDVALPCQTGARPCQPFQNRHSHPALAPSTTIIEDQLRHDSAGHRHDRAR